jgi:SAM-dependent methyltransferase
MDLRELPNAPTSRHPWEKARARFFGRLVTEEVARGRAVRVLDVGAGDGYLASTLLPALPDGSSVVCCDAHYSEAHLGRFAAETRGAITFRRELPAERFDVALLLDVLEHVPDDRALLGRIAGELLAPGGHVLVSVPALQALYTRHDVELGHHRRYGGSRLASAIEGAGLTAVLTGGLFYSLVAPRALEKALELVRGMRSTPEGLPELAHAETGLSSWHFGASITAAVDLVLELDARLSRLLSRRRSALPGLSLWALCRRTA